MVGHAASPTCIVHVDMTLTRSKIKVKVTGLLKFRKLHFSRSIYSAILVWCPKLMVDRDSTGPNLQLVWAQFSNFLLRKLSHEFILRGMSILHEFQMAIFPYCLRLRSHGQACWYSYMIWPGPDPRSKSKSLTVNFRKLHFSTSVFSAVLAWSSKLIVDFDSMGPSLQLFGARFLNFSLSWRSRDFRVR